MTRFSVIRIVRCGEPAIDKHLPSMAGKRPVWQAVARAQSGGVMVLFAEKGAKRMPAVSVFPLSLFLTRGFWD